MTIRSLDGRAALGSDKLSLSKSGGYNHIVIEDKLADRIKRKYGCLKLGNTVESNKIIIPKIIAILLIPAASKCFSFPVFLIGASNRCESRPMTSRITIFAMIKIRIPAIPNKVPNMLNCAFNTWISAVKTPKPCAVPSGRRILPKYPSKKIENIFAPTNRRKCSWFIDLNHC